MFVLACLLFACGMPAHAQTAPTVGYVFPAAAAPGTTVDVRLGGYDWTPDMQFFIHDQRIEMEILGPPGPIIVPEPSTAGSIWWALAWILWLRSGATTAS